MSSDKSQQSSPYSAFYSNKPSSNQSEVTNKNSSYSYSTILNKNYQYKDGRVVEDDYGSDTYSKDRFEENDELFIQFRKIASSNMSILPATIQNKIKNCGSSMFIANILGFLTFFVKNIDILDSSERMKKLLPYVGAFAAINFIGSYYNSTLYKQAYDDYFHGKKHKEIKEMLTTFERNNTLPRQV